MRTVCLSRSVSLDHENVRTLYQNIAKENFGALFILDTMDSVIEQVLEQNKCELVLYPPHKAAFKSKKLAYEDRAKRIVKYAQACYCILDSNDRSAGPILVATEFTDRHPNYPLTIFIVDEDGWKKVSVNEVKDTWHT